MNVTEVAQGDTTTASELTSMKVTVLLYIIVIHTFIYIFYTVTIRARLDAQLLPPPICISSLHLFYPVISSSVCLSCPTAPLTTTAPPAPTSPCPGGLVLVRGDAGCVCPLGMVQIGDNCTCAVGFTQQGAAECHGESTTWSTQMWYGRHGDRIVNCGKISIK